MFYTDPVTVKEFECPYQCGKPGTEGMRQVQWKGMQVLWELDCLGHAIRGKDFPYSAPPATPFVSW